VTVITRNLTLYERKHMSGLDLTAISKRFALAQEYLETKHRFSGERKEALEDSVADIPDLIEHVMYLETVIEGHKRDRTW
jgi:hypothetical protein